MRILILLGILLFAAPELMAQKQSHKKDQNSTSHYRGKDKSDDYFHPEEPMSQDEIKQMANAKSKDLADKYDIKNGQERVLFKVAYEEYLTAQAETESQINTRSASIKRKGRKIMIEENEKEFKKKISPLKNPSKDQH